MEGTCHKGKGGGGAKESRTEGTWCTWSAGNLCTNIMVGSPDPSVNGSTVVDSVSSTSTRKKRTIIVVRRPNKHQQHHDRNDEGLSSPQRKTVLVSRRPRPSEGRLFENNSISHAISLGAADGSGKAGGLPAQQFGGKLKWHPDGRVLQRSILGTAAAFEEVTTVIIVRAWSLLMLLRASTNNHWGE